MCVCVCVCKWYCPFPHFPETYLSLPERIVPIIKGEASSKANRARAVCNSQKMGWRGSKRMVTIMTIETKYFPIESLYLFPPTFSLPLPLSLLLTTIPIICLRFYSYLPFHYFIIPISFSYFNLLEWRR